MRILRFKAAKTIIFILSMVLISNSAFAELSIVQTDDGNQVKFEVKIMNSPEMFSFGVDVFYDFNALSYVNFERGDLVKDENNFPLFSVNMIEHGNLRIGAVGAIESGKSGTIAILTFDKIINQTNYLTAFGNGVDDCPTVPNSAPIVASNQIFEITSLTDCKIGRVSAIDDQNDILSFKIKSGDTELFDINSGGDVLLKKPVNCEILPTSKILEIEVSDNTLSTSQNLTVNFSSDVCKINLTYIISALQVLTGNKGLVCLNCDVNNDKKVWLDDVAYLLQIVAGVRIPK